MYNATGAGPRPLLSICLLWGVIEQKLLIAVGNIWNTLLTQAQPDIEAILEENFSPLARRLELSLNS
jgi:hypothetical protein